VVVDQLQIIIVVEQTRSGYAVKTIDNCQRISTSLSLLFSRHTIAAAIIIVDMGALAELRIKERWWVLLKRYYLLRWSYREQKSLSNVNNTHSSAAFMRSGSSSSITFVLLGEWEVSMYLLYVVMMVPCPTATTIRIAAVVVVLQELPVVAACDSSATLGGENRCLSTRLMVHNIEYWATTSRSQNVDWMTAEGGVICSGVQSATHMILIKTAGWMQYCWSNDCEKNNELLSVHVVDWNCVIINTHNHVTSDDVDESTSYDVSGNNIRVATMEL